MNEWKNMSEQEKKYWKLRLTIWIIVLVVCGIITLWLYSL
jgi:hypothetical protein